MGENQSQDPKGFGQIIGEGTLARLIGPDEKAGYTIEGFENPPTTYGDNPPRLEDIYRALEQITDADVLASGASLLDAAPPSDTNVDQ
jgi:hypothetical protein